MVGNLCVPRCVKARSDLCHGNATDPHTAGGVAQAWLAKLGRHGVSHPQSQHSGGRGQRQVDFELRASLIYIASSRKAKAT